MFRIARTAGSHNSHQCIHSGRKDPVGARSAGDSPPSAPRLRVRAHAELTAVILFAGFHAGALAADELPVRDPTRPPIAAGKDWATKQPVEGLRLRSTAVSDGGRSAVINDEVVTVGSVIGGAVVTGIEQGRVTLRRGADAIVLKLFTPAVKRPAGDSS